MMHVYRQDSHFTSRRLMRSRPKNGPPVEPLGPPPVIVEEETPADRVVRLTAAEVHPVIESNPVA
eukprot:12548233-Alexandrium_andersonii.AAC.1